MHVCKNKLKKAYTLYELVVYMMLIGLILYPLAPMLSYSVKQLKYEEDRYDPNFYNFVQDLKYDNVLSKEKPTCNNSNCSGDKTEISLTRLDDCKVSYSYDSTKKELERKLLLTPISCTDSKRTYKLTNIDLFEINSGYFISKTTGDKIDTKTIVLKIKSKKYNYDISYILYDKNYK